MPIDSSIAMGYQPIKLENPMNSLAQMMQIQNAQSQNRLADLTYQQHQLDQENNNALNAAYSAALGPDGKIDRTKLLQNLATSKLGSKIPTVQKSLLDADEAQQKVDKGGLELFDTAMKQRRDQLSGISTPEQYLAWHQGNHADPILGPMLKARGINPGDAQAAVEEALKQPGGLQALINQSALGMTKFAELNKPSIHTVNSGKVSTMYSVPGMGGAPSEVNVTQMTTTPGEDLTDSRTRSEGALNRGVTIRGQNLVDKRSSEANGNLKLSPGYRWADDTRTKQEPIPGGPADKGASASEGERKAATLLQRLEFSSAQLDAARKDKSSATKPGLISNGLEAIGMDSAANSIQSPERQRIEGAQLDMLDAALTLGTGAAYTREQLKGYAKSYFPQTGDDDKTIADKDPRLKNVIDAAKIAAGRAAKNVTAEAPKTSPVALPAVNAKGWALHTDAKGNRAYVSPDGKQFQEVK